MSADLPLPLAAAIAEECGRVRHDHLRAASAALTEYYDESQHRVAAPIWDTAHYAAYAAVRMPATFAAVSSAFQRLAATSPAFAPETLLDLCSGPGTASWAAIEIFPSIRSVCMLERDKAFVELSKRMAQQLPSAGARDIQWIASDALAYLESATAGAFDLIVLSYGANEMDTDRITRLAQEAWARARMGAVFVEPGTPAGFSAIHALRDELLALEARLAAPCPHDKICPLHALGRWCHFSVRLPRTKEHRMAKDAPLGYEDEKFSYVAAVRTEPQRPESRIVGWPRTLKHGIELDLCIDGEFRRELIPKRDRELHRAARRLEWGDGWP